MKKGAWIIVGAQWGDEGKGLISAYLAAREKATFVAKAGTGANAEHGIFLKDKETYLKVNQLPLGWMFNPQTEIRIGSGVAVDPVKLFGEIKRYKLEGRVKIDSRCPIITAEHIEAERQSHSMQSIGSTFSGTGFCKADFVLRKALQAKDIPSLWDISTDVSLDLNNSCGEKRNVIIESSQGTFLSLALSPDYPNTTSDNVTVCAAADDVLLNWQNIKEVVLITKALPTREGAGKMGKAKELTIEEIKERNLVEASSIGGVTRRKAGLDLDMLQYAVKVNGATQLAVTFCDHYDPEITDKKLKSEITPRVWALIQKIEDYVNVPVTLLNTGKAYDCIIDLTGKSINWESVSKKVEKLKKFTP